MLNIININLSYLKFAKRIYLKYKRMGQIAQDSKWEMKTIWAHGHWLIELWQVFYNLFLLKSLHYMLRYIEFSIISWVLTKYFVILQCESIHHLMTRIYTKNVWLGTQIYKYLSILRKNINGIAYSTLSYMINLAACRLQKYCIKLYH